GIGIREAAGQVLIGGFDGTTLPGDVEDALSAGRLGGTILFRRNITSLEQVAALNADIASASRRPTWRCVDQEGGRVVRLHPGLGATEVPPMRMVGEVGDPRLASRIGELLATEVAAVGFNVNFSPVLDVDTNPDNPIIGDRSFGDDPDHVATMGGA